MAEPQRAATLGELRKSGHRVLPVREEIRRNLMARMRDGSDLFPGVMGYEDSVIPQVENAILAGQDIIFLGENAARPSPASSAASSTSSTRRPPSSRAARSTTTPSTPICLACRTPARRAGRRPRDRLAAPRPALRREARHPRHLRRRPHRRDRPHQGRRGPLPLRRAHHPLRPHPPRQPRHLLHQRAPRPGRAHPGRPLQPHGGARHPDPRPPRPPPPRHLRRRQRQPGGLHQPRPHHHPPQGPLRRPHPHPLPQDRRGGGRPSSSRSAPASPTRRRPSSCPASWPRSSAEFTALARRSADINQRSGVSVRVSIANYETLAGLRPATRHPLQRVPGRAPRLRPALHHRLHPRQAGAGDRRGRPRGPRRRRAHQEGRPQRLQPPLRRRRLHRAPGAAIRGGAGGRGRQRGALLRLRRAPRRRGRPRAHGRSASASTRRSRKPSSPPAPSSSWTALHLNRKLNRDRVEGKFRYRT